MKWTFDDPVRGTWQGKPKLEITELRGPEYPRLGKENLAAYFPGKTVHLRLREKDADGNIRFEQGDSITLSAWVKPTSLSDKSFAYIVGKGRSDSPGFAADNQNYALRLKGAKGTAHVSFLFRSQKGVDHDEQYHRWTSDVGFPVGAGWHHVAVTYTFGKPETIRGYLDGKSVAGTWDMGGATTHPPVTDGDDVILGSAKKGATANTFHGWMDEIAIYRTALPDAVLARHALRVEPRETATAPANLPDDHIRVEISEQGVPTDLIWPAATLKTTESYSADVFGIYRTPHKYVDTGVRGDRSNPYMLRASAMIELPAGKHRLLLRARGAARLFIDGQPKPILTTPFPPMFLIGSTPIPTKYLDLGPDFRFAPPGNRESWVEFASTGKKHAFVLETIVGGRKNNQQSRPEFGETVVAISPERSTSFRLVGPKSTVPYTDAGWAEYAEKEEARLLKIESDRRKQCLDRYADDIAHRRERDRQYLAQTPEVPVPRLPAGFPAFNEIDHFIATKIAAVRSEAGLAQGKVDFHKEVKPILEGRCFNCHQGKKAKGGLRLDTIQGMLEGGASDSPAVVRGSPEKSLLIERIASHDPKSVMPPQGNRLTDAEVATLRRWIEDGAPWSVAPAGRLELTPLTKDLAFLRRLSLDVVGVVPTAAEVREFLSDTRLDKRSRWIDRYLADPRWADRWVGYWQDVLAENPNILNPTLNNTGPYRWWIYESFLDNKPLDLFAAELVRMSGSLYQGGPAGFAMASENDVPMAEKGVIVASAFLGVKMQCARCHDAPAHKSMQKELFQLAAMLGAGPITVPKTSSVPQDKIHDLGRTPLIKVTLKPGTKVEPAWPFAEFVAADQVPTKAGEGTRDRVAELLTAAENERFAQVMANRIWQRFMGRGLVEPIDDWEKGEATDPALLRFLARELVRSGYDAKSLTRIILQSHAYQRAVDPELAEPSPWFVSPARRRLDAEQIVDSLFQAAGKRMNTEEVSLDVDGTREMKNSISLGKPRRAWQFASTSNERDRPSLALPRVQAVVDVLEAFGWRATRQDARSSRDAAPNILQPAILANGTMSTWLTRLSDEHGTTELALKPQPVETLIEEMFLKVLTRKPRPEELAAMTSYLADGYDSRVLPTPPPGASKRVPPKYVSWSNHLTNEASTIKIQLEAAARRGDPPTPRLRTAWRQRLEDVLWSLLNDPEFVFSP